MNEKCLGEHFFKPYKADQRQPDIIVLSLQEVAPLSYCFVGQRWIEPYLSRIVAAVDHTALQSKYHTVATHAAGMTAIIVLATDEAQSRISWVEKADVGVGVWDMGNKGAVGIRLGYLPDHSDTEIGLTFVAAHLAAHEMEVSRRNQDWENIVRRLAFAPGPRTSTPQSSGLSHDDAEAESLLGKSGRSDEGPSGMFASRSLVFFGGDLNYRTSDKRPEKNDFQSFPQPTGDHDDAQHYTGLLKEDQLTRERSTDKTLHKLTEPPVNFPPSYKYDLDYYQHADAAMRGVDNEPSSWHWATHRNPSWCDRILFSSYLAGQSSAARVHAYTILPIQPTTDHRPVALALEVDLEKVARIIGQDVSVTEPPFPLSPRALSLRSAARTCEIVVGVLAYFSTTWEGRGILLATAIGLFSGWLILRSVGA